MVAPSLENFVERVAGRFGIQFCPVCCYPACMCARYTLTKDEIRFRLREKIEVFGVVPRYNIAPSQEVPVIIEFEGRAKLMDMRWGWKPVWGNQLLINAQAETVDEKPTFKRHLHQRCLIPADGFIEWLPDKTPVRFTRAHDEPFCFGGLWRTVEFQPLDVPVLEYSCVILTTTPNESVARVHNRMPFIVQPEHYDWWLGDGYKLALGSPDKSPLDSQYLSRAINNPRKEGPELLVSQPSPKG